MTGAGRTVIRKAVLILALALAYGVQAMAFPDNLNGSLFQQLLGFAPWLADEKARLVLGAVGYGMAMVLFATSTPPLSRRSEKGDKMQYVFRIQGGRRGAWGMMVLTVVLLGWSMVRFVSTGEDGVTRGLWMGSIMALATAIGLMAWIERKFRVPRPVFRWRHVTVLAAILTGAAWLRFHLLADIPQDLHGDMASMGLQARDILAGVTPGLFHQGWAEIPMLGFFPSVLGLKLVSNSIFGLNFIPAVEGLLVIAGLYLLAWRMFDSHRVAALAAAALAVNIPHIHFSRLAAYMDPWPWLVFACFLLAHGLRVRKLWPFPLAGLLVGIGIQMYYSGRVVLVILPAATIYFILLHPRAVRQGWRFGLWGTALFGLGVITALGPSLIYFLQHTEALLARSRAVFLFHEPVMIHLMGKYGVHSPGAVLWEQIKRSALMFNYVHDTSTQFGYTHPMFSLALSPLVLLGIGYSLRRWRHPGAGFTLIWLLAILVTGSVLTNNAPFWPRLVGILPAAALMVGVALDTLLKGLGLTRPMRSIWEPSPNAVVIWSLVIVFILLGQHNWRAYFLFTANNARPQARIGRYLDSLPDELVACGFSSPFHLSERETAFLAWPHPTFDLNTAVTGPLLDICPGPKRVWILDPQNPSQRIRVQRRWPQGQLREHRDGTGRVVFLSYLVAQPQSIDKQDPVQATSSAYLPDGGLFRPQYTYFGSLDSQPARWRVASVQVQNGRVRLTVGPLPGHDAVFDYVEFLDPNGQRHRFEAESLSFETDMDFAPSAGQDNRWWLQPFAPFSGGAGLVAQKNEIVPALRASIPLPDGYYDVTIGTFTGDPANGVFALGVSLE